MDEGGTDTLNAAELYEEARVRAVERLGLLDTPPETEYDEVVQLAAAVCATPMAAIGLIDTRREWFKAVLGAAVTEVPREIAICDHTIRSSEMLIVEDATADPRFAETPLVTGALGLRFYAGVPLLSPDELPVGALCVVDREPRTLNEQQRTALCVLARQVTGRMKLRVRERELAEALAEKDRIAAGLAEYQALLEEANDRLRNLAGTDELTGLRNRRAFEERLVYELAMAKRKQRELSLVMLDVDDFKRINDTYGHPEGDAVLRAIGAVLRATARETDVAARYGGEEFAVLLPESDAWNTMQWCARLQQAMAEAEWHYGRVTVSLGLASRGGRDLTPREMVAEADRALYRAKAMGKNRAMGAGCDFLPQAVEALCGVGVVR